MKTTPRYSTPEQPFGKSYTPKRYLHPPFSENLAMLWANGMIFLGETKKGHGSQRSSMGIYAESALDTAGMAFTFRDEILPMKGTQFFTRADGVPVHAQEKTLENFTFLEECFCSIDRVPTVYVKITVKNPTDKVIEDKFGVLVRTGGELSLLGSIDPDGYVFPTPVACLWLRFPLWAYEEGKATDGTYALHWYADKDVDVRQGIDSLDYGDKHFIYFSFSLQPGEERSAYFAFGRRNIPSPFSYDLEKKKAEDFWKRELGKATLPEGLNSGVNATMVYALLTQCLQMFSYPKDGKYLLLRQGGLQRVIWPTEARSIVRGLARLGGYADYIDTYLDTCFNICQTDSGEVVNFGIPWGSITGAVLYAFGSIANYDRGIYEKYKEPAYKAFLWMEAMRKKSTDDPDLVSGIFPPMRSSDYSADGQMYADTDAWNLQGYRLYLQALETQKDEHAPTVKAAYADYFAAFKAVTDKARLDENGKLHLPIEAKGDPAVDAVMEKMIFSKTAQENRIVGMGALGYGTARAEAVLSERENRGLYSHGLTCPFASSLARKDGKQWYLSLQDEDLYFYFRRSGENDTAKKILDAQLDYGMTPEYYMSERYDDSNPYYTPWCPNGSAAGRTIALLFD